MMPARGPERVAYLRHIRSERVKKIEEKKRSLEDYFLTEVLRKERKEARRQAEIEIKNMLDKLNAPYRQENHGLFESIFGFKLF